MTRDVALSTYIDGIGVPWDALARFLSTQFERSFRPDGLRWELSQRSVLVLATTSTDEIVGSQAFLAIPLNAPGPCVTAKSERTLLHPAYRGTSLFADLYRLALEFAASELKPSFYWGLTATPRAFMKMGYWDHTPVYAHTVVPTARPFSRLFATGGAGRDRLIETHGTITPDLSTAKWQFRTHPDYVPVESRIDGARAIATVQGNRARLRVIEAGSRSELGKVLAALMDACRVAGASSLRLSFNPVAPLGAYLQRLLLACAWPWRPGGGHFIVRPLVSEDLRVIGSRENWNLTGWEDVIHDPV